MFLVVAIMLIYTIKRLTATVLYINEENCTISPNCTITKLRLYNHFIEAMMPILLLLNINLCYICTFNFNLPNILE